MYVLVHEIVGENLDEVYCSQVRIVGPDELEKTLSNMDLVREEKINGVYFDMRYVGHEDLGDYEKVGVADVTRYLLLRGKVEIVGNGRLIIYVFREEPPKEDE